MLRCKELMHWILSQEVWDRDLAGTVCCVLEQDKTLARLASHLAYRLYLCSIPNWSLNKDLADPNITSNNKFSLPVWVHS